jgi:hypothetical protein
MLARSIRRLVATATSSSAFAASHHLVFARHHRTATAQQVAAARNPELGARPPNAAFAQLQNAVLVHADAFADDKGALRDACAALRAELDHYAKSATNAPHKNALTGMAMAMAR